MATLQERRNGTFEIQYRDEYGRKKTITLSGRRYTEGIAKELKDAVAVLIYERVNHVGIPHRKTKDWVENAPFAIREKLARLGLCQVSSRHTASELWNLFLDKHPFKKERTRSGYLQSKDRFFLFFGEDELLATLTQDRMREWKAFLLGCGKFSVSTVTGTIEKTKAVFKLAREQHWITESPLKGVGAGEYRNEETDYIVSQDEYRQLLGACPCQEWRVIVTLARIGGMRPCEIMNLRWMDIDAENNWFVVYSPKLKGHKRYKREVPLFPEVATELDKLRSLPGNEGQDFVINCYTNREVVNLGQPFDRITKSAGIDKIPRPFDNMRASRANEVRQRWGEKLESLWIGHSAKIANEYYYVATPDDYAVAAGRMAINPASMTVIGRVPEATPEWSAATDCCFPGSL